MTKYVLEDMKKSRLTVISLWLVYACAYFSRTCYSAAIASIVSDGIYNKSQIGLVGTAFFVCYGAGQLVSGIVGDRVNPFAMILLGSFSSAACCLSMALAESLALMAAIWGINGIFQSMLWAPMLRIFSETVNVRLREKAVLHIALSVPVGTVCAYLCSTVIIRYRNWSDVFLCGGAVLSAAFLLVLLTVLYERNAIVKQYEERNEERTDSRVKPDFRSVVLSSGLLWVVVPSFLHGMMRDGITNWVPTMITEEYGTVPSFSVFITVVLPIFNAFGAYAVTPLYKKLGGNEMKTVAACAGLATVPTVLLLLIGKIPVFVCVLLLALTTMSMYSLNYLIISRVPVRFSEMGRTSSVTGILNSAAYAGCALSSYGFGAVAQNSGWRAVVAIWIFSAVLIAAFAGSASRKHGGFIRGKARKIKRTGSGKNKIVQEDGT